MYVKMKPCDMCVRALKAYDELLAEKSYILYPNDAKKSSLPRPIGEYDIVARKILENIAVK